MAKIDDSKASLSYELFKIISELFQVLICEPPILVILQVIPLICSTSWSNLELFISCLRVYRNWLHKYDIRIIN